MVLAPLPKFEVGFGVVGVGNIAPVHAQALASIPGAKLRAFLGRRRDATQAMADRFGVDAMVDAERFFARPDIQVVTIATPNGTHAELGARAARAGKHVLVEKPIEVTLEKAHALIGACRQHGVSLGVLLQSRFLPAVRLIKRAIDNGRLGRIYMADAYVKWFRPRSYYEAAAWRGTRALDGGGALINQAIHTVDLLQHVAGPVSSVFGMTDKLRHSHIECEDAAWAVVRFRSGATGVIQASTAVAPGFLRRLELHGERGSIILEGDEITTWRLDNRGEEEAELERWRAAQLTGGNGAPDPRHVDLACRERQLEDFLDAIREERCPAIDGEEGCRALEIVLGVYQSAESGAPVTLPL
jgi:predicted dehydrogenase